VPAARLVPASVVEIGVGLVVARVDRCGGGRARGRRRFLRRVRVDIGLVDIGLVPVRRRHRHLAEAVVAPVVVILRARTLILPARLAVRSRSGSIGVRIRGFVERLLGGIPRVAAGDPASVLRNFPAEIMSA
jgi:hypothetical protein